MQENIRPHDMSMLFSLTSNVSLKACARESWLSLSLSDADDTASATCSIRTALGKTNFIYQLGTVLNMIITCIWKPLSFSSFGGFTNTHTHTRLSKKI